MVKEKCVGSFLESIDAQNKGADRIELCENLYEGGTTPSYGTIKKVLSSLNIPVFVMIRPRGGDFVYSIDEVELMKEDIKICRDLGAQGVVFGALEKDFSINYKIIEELVLLSKPMSITFHKAIDELKEPIKEISRLADIGVDRILTSGTKSTALEGRDILNAMIEESRNKLKIVVAGRVTKDNFNEIYNLILNEEYHGKEIV